MDAGGKLAEILVTLVETITEVSDNSVRKITVDTSVGELPSDVVGSLRVGDILVTSGEVAIVSLASDSQVTLSIIPQYYANIKVIKYIYEDGAWVIDESE